jgi:pyridoxine 5-phosphate synthase
MKTNLSVNLNKVALLRNQRSTGCPDVLDLAHVVTEAGADGITVHPRPDGRHIKYSDVHALADLIARGSLGSVELNIEGFPSRAFLELARSARPSQVTLVPDSDDQLTSDHGWDLATAAQQLRPVVAELAAQGIRVSLFVDPDPDEVAASAEVGAHRIELFTGPYASAFDARAYAQVLTKYRLAADAAIERGLAVNAGHDLTLDNLPPFKASLPMLAEVSVGHAITADALRLGFAKAVRAYQAAIA